MTFRELGRGILLLFVLLSGGGLILDAAAGEKGLFKAAKKGDTTAIEALIADGAELDALDRKDRSALHLAARHDQQEAARLLLDAGAKANIGEDGETPLLCAVINGSFKVAEVLLAGGADPDLKDKAGLTPLHHAAIPAMAALLLDGGAAVDAPDRTGRTALHRQVVDCRQDLVAVLIAGGADVNLKDKEGLTPLLLAVGEAGDFTAGQGYHRETGAVLFTDPSVAAPRGGVVSEEVYAGGIACMLPIVSDLVEAGADVNARDRRGRTPLDLAEQEETRDLLLSFGGRSGG